MRRGISVRVVTPGHEKVGAAELDGVPVHRVPSASAFANGEDSRDSIQGPLAGPSQWAGLYRLYRKLRAATEKDVARGASLVHVHGWAPAGLAAPEGIPLVLSVQAPDASLLRHSRVARALARNLFQRARVVTAVSREVGSWIQSGMGRHLEPSHIHPLPIETRGHPWTRGGGGALVIARLLPASRVELAIRTAAVLASCGHDLPLTILGVGPERAALE
jgi:hypothetical protein